MLKHIVLFKLKDSAAGTGKDENACKLKAELDALAGKIPQIVKMEVGSMRYLQRLRMMLRSIQNFRIRAISRSTRNIPNI
jgi:hypothetical protein